MELNNKIDFMLFFTADHCNPNGDPINNRPRIDFNGYGEITDVCLKRKIRNRLQDMGESIFVQSNDRSDDGCLSMRERAFQYPALKEALDAKNSNGLLASKLACEKWIDVRAFGQVFAFKGKNAVSIGIRGAASIGFAKSVAPVCNRDIAITKSMNSEDNTYEKDSSTMGMKYIIDKSAYVAKGSIFPSLANATGLTVEDTEKIKHALCTLFENDISSARPAGSMGVTHLYWWQHTSRYGSYSPIKVFNSLTVTPQDDFPYYSIEEHPLEGLTPEVYVGY